MQISITSKKIDIGESLRTHMEDKMKAILSKYDLTPVEVSLMIHKDGHHRDGNLVRCDIDIHLKKGIFVRSHAEADDAYLSMDKSSEILEGRIRRYKHKISSFHRKGDTNMDTPAHRYILETQHEEKEEDHLIVAEMKTSIPRLTVAEAVMHLDLSDVTAFMFHNDALDVLNVVYRRPDGNIGWISPAQQQV